jgi:hypothetical protein
MTDQVLGRLDFVYCPSRDAAVDRDHWTDRLGAEPVFAIERFDTRVACVQPGEGPMVLFAQHLDGDRPILLYRVDDLAGATEELRRRGVEVGEPFGFPYGEGAELANPGPQRVAVYERNQPERGESIRGRRDF